MNLVIQSGGLRRENTTYYMISLDTELSMHTYTVGQWLADPSFNQGVGGSIPDDLSQRNMNFKIKEEDVHCLSD